MIQDNRFFHEFFDGQIVKPVSEKYQMFKLMLVSCFSVVGLTLAMLSICSWAEFILLEMGMIWNFYSGLGKQLSLAFAVVVALLYFYFVSIFSIYGTGLVYIAFYIPLQMIAISKDYSDGDFIQIRKKVNRYNGVIFVSIYVVLFAVIALIDLQIGSRFVLLDSLAAATLVCSALLRNERYNEYYLFRILALLESIVLWIVVLIEFNSTTGILITLMYASYLIFDIVTWLYQKNTYVNEYMIKVQEYKEIQEQHLIEEKIKAYNLANEEKEKEL